MESLRPPGLKVVADADDNWADDVQSRLLLDLPNGSVFEGLPWLKEASRNREVWGMGAFPLANEDLAGGVQEDDPDADLGTGEGVGGHKGSHLREDRTLLLGLCCWMVYLDEFTTRCNS